MSRTRDYHDSRRIGIMPILITTPLMALILMIGTPATAVGQSGLCGDVNQDLAVNVGDVVAVISYIFKGGPPPMPLCGGDVNGDGEVNIGDAVYLINWIFRGGPPPVCMPGIGLIDQTGCKNVWKGAIPATPPTEDCLEFEYDGESVLSLWHINAGFNCCPGEIIVDAIVEGNSITIYESELLPQCYCLCLFDLDMSVYFLEPGEYTIYVVEPYVYPEDEPLEFTVDLTTTPSGGYCVTRDNYPWGPSGSPFGQIIGHTDCKNLLKDTDSISFDYDCLAYQYDGQDVLSLQHINAGFNCCPGTILADFTFSENTITITEGETLEGGGCDCLCLFDVDYEITGIAPGEITVIVQGLYLDVGEDPLTIIVDLNEAPSDTICVLRTHYPWGEL